MDASAGESASGNVGSIIEDNIHAISGALTRRSAALAASPLDNACGKCTDGIYCHARPISGASTASSGGPTARSINDIY